MPISDPRDTVKQANQLTRKASPPRRWAATTRTTMAKKGAHTQVL